MMPDRKQATFVDQKLTSTSI